MSNESKEKPKLEIILEERLQSDLRVATRALEKTLELLQVMEIDVARLKSNVSISIKELKGYKSFSNCTISFGGDE